MICSHQIKRKEALEILKQPAYPPELMEEDKRIICKRWNLQEEIFDKIIENRPNRSFEDYESYSSKPIYLPVRALKRLASERVI